MSLVDDMSSMCVRVCPVGKPDGEGGTLTDYVEGHRFAAAVVRVSATASRVGEQDGTAATYTVTTAEALKSGDLFRREADGKLFRCTSDAADGAAPGVASFSFMQCGAEEREEPDAD